MFMQKRGQSKSEEIGTKRRYSTISNVTPEHEEEDKNPTIVFNNYFIEKNKHR